jgi:hypothetical protein
MIQTLLKIVNVCQIWWLIPIILATQEAEIWSIGLNLAGKSFRSPYLENTHHKKRASGVAQGEGPKFKPQYHKVMIIFKLSWTSKTILSIPAL